MAFTQSDLTNIQAAIASGVLETRFADGRMVRYQTLGEMMQAEQRIAAALSSAAGKSTRRYPAYRNGC